MRHQDVREVVYVDSQNRYLVGTKHGRIGRHRVPRQIEQKMDMLDAAMDDRGYAVFYDGKNLHRRIEYFDSRDALWIQLPKGICVEYVFVTKKHKHWEFHKKLAGVA